MDDNRDPFENAEAVARQRVKRGKHRAERRQEDLKKFLKDAAGRRILYWLLGEAGIYRNPFVNGDVHATHINIGMQKLGLILVTDLELAKPGVVSQMIHEHVSEARQDKMQDEVAKKSQEA